MFDGDRLDDVCDILASVGDTFQQFVNLLPFGHLEDRPLAFEERGDGVSVQIVCQILQPIDLNKPGRCFSP